MFALILANITEVIAGVGLFAAFVWGFRQRIVGRKEGAERENDKINTDMRKAYDHAERDLARDQESRPTDPDDVLDKLRKHGTGGGGSGRP